jgi:hypothetical protein
VVSDPVAARRARIAHGVAVAKRVGYVLLLVGIVAFFVGLATSFPSWAVTTTLICLIASFVILPLPIVLGYGVRAAEREDRARGRAPGPTSRSG